MERMLRRVIGEDVELTTALEQELWRVKADPGQIEQAILNLVVNARDAMPRGGRLTVETANVELDEKFAGLYATVHPGPHVMLAVSDTGVGMDAELQARLFEPFFTTKERGKGTGLGLSTTYGIVKQSGGRSGSTASPATARRSRSTCRDRQNGRGLLEGGKAREAIALARRHEAPIELLLTDVIMPGMNGRELARILAETRPRMKVLYMSGYTDAAISQQGILAPGTAFLSKPFTPDVLARKVREVIDGPVTM